MKLFFFTFLAIMPLSEVVAFEDSSLRDAAQKQLGMIKPVGPADIENPEVKLGQSLFWDTRLSADGNTSCASCHLSKDWGADHRQFSRDARGKETSRNSQTVFNSTLQPSLRWIGDRRSAAHQAEKSLTGSMGFSSPEAVIPLLETHGYKPLFEAAYPQQREPITPSNYARAIESYEKTLLTPSAFDRFLSGENDALNHSQKNGLQIFLNVGCVDCHSGPVLGGRSLKKFGLKGQYIAGTSQTKADQGLFEATKVESDRNVFRVSMLRNVAKTSPYFHDGGVLELKKAVQIMAEIQLGERLVDQDADALVSFLEALTGEIPVNYRSPSSTESKKTTQ